MPILRMKDIHEMSLNELHEKIVELRVELVRLRTMVAAGGAVENPSRLREMRKTIARLLTVETELEKKR